MLKRGDDGELSEGSAERDAKENHAGRDHQVSRSYLTLHTLTNVKFFIAFVFFCAVSQLSVPAAEPAPGLPEDHHLPESHISQRGRLQRQGDSTRGHLTSINVADVLSMCVLLQVVLLAKKKKIELEPQSAHEYGFR